MKKKISRVASLMLAVMMLISLLPAGVLASETVTDEITISGTIELPDDAVIPENGIECAVLADTYGNEYGTYDKYCSNVTLKGQSTPFDIVVNVKINRPETITQNVYGGLSLLDSDGAPIDSKYYQLYSDTSVEKRFLLSKSYEEVYVSFYANANSSSSLKPYSEMLFYNPDGSFVKTFEEAKPHTLTGLTNLEFTVPDENLFSPNIKGKVCFEENAFAENTKIEILLYSSEGKLYNKEIYDTTSGQTESEPLSDGRTFEFAFPEGSPEATGQYLVYVSVTDYAGARQSIYGGTDYYYTSSGTVMTETKAERVQPAISGNEVVINIPNMKKVTGKLVADGEYKYINEESYATMIFRCAHGNGSASDGETGIGGSGNIEAMSVSDYTENDCNLNYYETEAVVKKDLSFSCYVPVFMEGEHTIQLDIEGMGTNLLPGWYYYRNEKDEDIPIMFSNGETEEEIRIDVETGYAVSGTVRMPYGATFTENYYNKSFFTDINIQSDERIVKTDTYTVELTNEVREAPFMFAIDKDNSEQFFIYSETSAGWSNTDLKQVPLYYVDNKSTAESEEQASVFAVTGDIEDLVFNLKKESEEEIADNTTFTVRDGDTESTPVIAEASLTITDASGNAVARSTGASGKVTLDLADGEYTVAALADGYQARSFKIKRSKTNKNFTVYLNKDEIIKVTSTVKEMTKEEIKEAGIDPEANKHVYNCSAVLTFMPDVVINYIYSEGGKVLKGETVTHGNTAVTPVARDIFLIVKSSTAWLKEIFEVQLICDNTSAVETIEKLTANMTIPDGLSLAIMAEGEQSNVVNLGDVAPKGNASHKWYICGDKEGEYKLSGALTGTRVGGGIKEDINLGFSIEEPITVLAGSAMELTIDAGKQAVVGKPYRMRYALENTSDKTLYDLAFTVFGGKFFEDYHVTAIEYAREYGPDAMTDENLDGEGFLFETEEFKPGEKISGVFTIEFGEGLDLSQGQGWRLVDAFVVTGAGSTTEIPTTINWISDLPVHNWNDGEVTKAPTCTTDGEKTYTCLDTNCDIKTKKEIIPATGHNMGDYVTTDPTCTGDGSKTSECRNDGCDHSVSLPIAALGHDWKTEKEEDKAPTCTEAGLKSIHCTRCKETKDAEEIGKLGHDMGDWNTTVEPGCESTGTERRECSRGDYFEENTLSATDHKWDAGKVTTPPTEEKEGERTFTCENGCGKTKTEVIPKLVLQEVEFPFSETTITYGDKNTVYNEVYNNSEGGGVISYTSSDESVATVEAGGKVTIVGAGETTITATAAATEKYTATSASYKLTVKKAPLTVKPKAGEIFYGENAAFSEVEGEGFVLGEDVSVLTGDAVFATDYKAFDKAGEYEVAVSGITAKNYEITFAPGVLSVKKAEKYELVISKLSYRKGDSIEVKVEIIPKDETAAIKLEYSTDGKEWSEKAPEEIGKYMVRASLVKSDNIAIPETPVYTEAEFEIKAGAMITVGKEGGLEIGMETDEKKGTVEFTADDETVKKVIDNVPPTGEVVIDATGATDGINTLVLPQNIVKALDESDKVDSFTIIADDAEITMDADVLSTVAKEMKENSTVSVKIDAVEKSELNKKQQEALDAISAEAHVIQLNLVVTNYDESGNPTSEDIHELYGKVDIKAKYDLYDNMDGKRIIVCHVSDNGTVTYKRAEYKDGFVHFTTDHFSYYAIMATECPHDWDDGEIITPATTTSEGLIRYTCLLCDDTKDEAIPKKIVTSGNGGGFSAGGDKSNSGADKLGNEDDKKEDADVSPDAPAVSAPKFTDLGAHAWAADAINALAEAGIIKGTSGNTFSPAANITRADFAILLVRAFGLTSDSKENFADVSANDYFVTELAIARNTGIVGGIGGNKFAPRNAITRQDMMTIVYRALKNAKVDGIVAPEMTDEVALSKTYTDFALVSDYAKDAVSVLSHMHFVNGKNGRIEPNDYTTRAEVAVLLQRILEFVK